MFHCNFAVLNFISCFWILQSGTATSQLNCSLRPSKKKQQRHSYQTRSAQVRRPGSRSQRSSQRSSQRQNSDSQIESGSEGDVCLGLTFF